MALSSCTQTSCWPFLHARQNCTALSAALSPLSRLSLSPLSVPLDLASLSSPPGVAVLLLVVQGGDRRSFAQAHSAQGRRSRQLHAAQCCNVVAASHTRMVSFAITATCVSCVVCRVMHTRCCWLGCSGSCLGRWLGRRLGLGGRCRLGLGCGFGGSGLALRLRLGL